MNAELELNDLTLKSIIELVHRHTGITMSEKKKSLLQSRLRPRLRELSLPTYEAYISYLSSHQEETDNFIDLVTTNETFFFRTQRVWDFFNGRFLPEWFKQNPHEVLKIWSGASSSGEEVYSLVISLLEFKEKNAGFRFELIASDISKEILREAAAAQYGARSVEGLKKYNPQWFEKYIKTSGSHWTVTDEVKKNVNFFCHNLFHGAVKKKHFDIIFLRNVMIYFNNEDQEKILRFMSEALKSNGVLVLGESESISRLNSPFLFKEPLVYVNPK